MKKHLSIILAGSMLLCMGSTSMADEEASLNLISDGVLTIGHECGYPPFEYYAEDGTTPIGFDIDTAYAVADKLGLEVNFIDTAWDGIFAGIGTNYDVVISAATITPEREEEMLFSNPYITNYQSVVVPAGSDIKIESLNDLDGMTVALQKETTSDILITDLIDTKTIDATIVANEKVTTCFSQLLTGEVDVVLCDSTVADGYLANDPDKYELAYLDQTEPEEFGIAMSLDNTDLKAAIDDAIAELEEEGFFEDNNAKWFGAPEEPVLIADGVLTVGHECGYPPFEYYAEDGTTPIGFDIDTAYAVADKLGLEVNFIDTAWDGIFAGIGTNYDVVISAATITPEREEEMLFSNPYITNYQSVVVPAGSDIKIESLNDLDGMTVALQKETTSDILITDLIDTKTIDATIVANEKVTTCFSQLLTGEVDVVLCDSTVADGYLANDPDKYELAYLDQTEPEEFGIAMSLDNTGLKAAIDDAIAELEEEGFFDDNNQKWFGSGEEE